MYLLFEYLLWYRAYASHEFSIGDMLKVIKDKYSSNKIICFYRSIYIFEYSFAYG